MTDIIEAHDLSWHYMPLTADGQPVQALDHVSLSVRQGEFLAVTGATGAGKSTLCLALTGLIPSSVDGFMHGQVLVNGDDTNQVAVADIARHVGYVQQEPRAQLFSITVEDEIAFPLENMGVPYDQMDRRITDALNLVSMNEFRKRKPTALSGGQMQRVAIAAALVSEPDVLILDEPTAALDSAGKSEVFAALETIRNQRPITIVMAEQETDWITQFTDRVIVMDEGRIIRQGDPALFADEPELFISNGIELPEACEMAWKLNEAEHCTEGVDSSGNVDDANGGHAYHFATADEALRALSNGGLAALGGQQVESHASTVSSAQSPLTSPPMPPMPFASTQSVQAMQPERRNLTNQADQPRQQVRTSQQHSSRRNSPDRQLSSGIAISHLSYSYDDSPALSDVSLSIPSGMFLALLGRNGSGKTTLAKHLNGLLTPTSGSVTVDGLDTSKYPIGVLAQHVGMVFQNPDDQIFCSSVRDEIAFGPKSIGYDAANVQQLTDDVIRQFGLHDLSDAPPATLGYGDRKKVAIASVFAMNSGIIVLDEPTAGLNRAMADQLLGILANLNAQGVTVIIISHDMRAVARICSHAAVLDDGRLLGFDTTRDILTDTALLSKAGCAVPLAVQASLALGVEPHEAALTPSEFAARFVPATRAQSDATQPKSPTPTPECRDER
ncbi:MAG: energy-coupling factor ABC transporter ATP-binding protein [Bifidobacterium tibiigranuli]|jgi:energy-coupling factor transport system ATP-binding protein|uniref:ABC transporter ATP-binding protein n=1 Tax=Bifidobacterium tibiigranuli TaxID=2172043 RepID=UPI0026ECD6C9|nr:ABC transporter ATP-binding protein [Bifidobacterium tibiigranuli]MCI1674176.1 energy-coupling factor ABC transporter ATP-binding protein [Bifidobacterium tibiigranuli]MCI1712463.1 energy-coupling factor ABC transporter ATP-binding protein [Bifidobacterium tibiigranuli]